mgnify:CR=1 FL=1
MTPVVGYTEMRDSGIEWVGEIPAHWTTIANKYVMRKKKRICEKWKNQNVLSLTMNGVVVRDILNPVGKMPTTFDGYQFAYSGELLMCLFDIDVTPRCVGRVFCDGVTSPAYSCFQLNNHADLGYYYYYYLMVDNTKELLHLAKNLRHSFTEEQLGMLKVPFPPFKEQSAIAAYLDSQCAKIDEIIAEAKTSIEDYKQWKASIIYEAVTKGLDPNVEMKDSGIEWIGEIPKGWNTCRIKNATINMDNLREPISAENRENKLGLYDYYGASGVIDKIDSYNVDDTVLLIGEDGANLKMRNLPLVYRASGKFWVNNHAHILKVSSNNCYGYIAYLLEAGDYTTYITGSAQPKLSQFNLMRFPIVVPPISEQIAIEKHLDSICSKIDGLIWEKQSSITDLETYKKSLIYEVVTGKRRVC